MKKIIVLTPPDARHGFSLTGVEQRVTPSAELMKALRDITSEANAGVIVIDERLIETAMREALAVLERKWSGAIVLLPAPEKEAHAAEDYVLQLIRRAIGYQVRLSL
jgi:V/A-type H+-transporting ATPase subunit F